MPESYGRLVKIESDIAACLDWAVSARLTVGHFGYVSFAWVADAVGRAFLRTCLFKTWHALESIVANDEANPPILWWHWHSGVA